jgi:hypothetical protein
VPTVQSIYSNEKKYWERAYPDGVFGEVVRNMIDIDECCLKLESTNRNYGKVVRELRCDAQVEEKPL